MRSSAALTGCNTILMKTSRQTTLSYTMICCLRFQLHFFSQSYITMALKHCFMLQGSWGPLKLRLSTTWRWAANFWLLVSWLKRCPTTTLLWVRLHTDALADTFMLLPLADIFILQLCSTYACPFPYSHFAESHLSVQRRDLVLLPFYRGRLKELSDLLQASCGVPSDGKIQIRPARPDQSYPAQT